MHKSMLTKSLQSGLAWVLDRWFIKNPRLRLMVTKWFYGNKDTRINLAGTSLLINATKENGYLRAYKAAQRSSLWRDEIATVCALFATLRPGDLFVDVGANIGLFSCLVSRVPEVKVLALEACPDTFQRLEKNCRDHGIEAINTAVSNSERLLDFCAGAVSHVFAAAIHRNSYHFGKTVQILARPLDDLIQMERPIVLKIDVEGHEPEVLEGCSRLLNRGLIHGVFLDASSEARKAAQWLASRGFEIVDPSSFKELTESSSVYLALSRERRCVLGLC